LEENKIKNKRILITGGCGFIGHHLVEHIIKNTDWDIIVLDKLTYASEGFNRLRDINCFNEERVLTLTMDFTKEFPQGIIKEIGDVDYIVHMGAETHVDRSIEDPEPFVMSNVIGTMRVLDFARKQKNLSKMIYFSTDEIFGPAPEGVEYKEWDRYNSTNPYSASKAGGEELCLAYENTYKVPILITHTMNVFGERQHPEKFIPMTIKKVLDGKKILIHSDKLKSKPGSRFWIHARNVASVLLFLLDKGDIGDKYNIVGEKEVDNLEMAQIIAKILDKPLDYEMIDFHSLRPGHDLRYALSGEKLNKMGFKYPKKFEESLKNTIEWCLKPENINWININNN